MPKYQAIFSGETHTKEILGKHCAFVISLSFQQPENLKTNDLSKYIANIERLNSAFVKTDIVLSDSLNRHNSSIYYPYSNSEEKALALGDKWLNSPYHRETNKLKNSTSPLIRWTNLISTEDYKKVLKITEALCKQNMSFSSVVECVCAKFVAFICDKRKKAIEKNLDTIDSSTGIDYSNFDILEVYKNCHKYVLEECAVTLIFRLRGYTHLFHIGKVNDAVDWIAKNSITHLSSCNRDLIEKLNNNPLKVTIPLQYKPYETSVINFTLENTENAENSKTKIKKNINVVNFFKNLQLVSPSKSTPCIPCVKHELLERRKSYH